MSLQELKAQLIETISQMESEEEVRIIRMYAEDLHQSMHTGRFTEAELEGIRLGEAQIDAGQHVTIEEMNREAHQAIAEGLRLHKEDQARRD